MPAPFVHLHVHTDYSLLDGAAKCETLAARAKALGMPALAITDHGNMFGVLRFQAACKKNGVKPLIGSEFYVAGGSRLERSGTEEGNKYYHLILIAHNQTGYRNLMVLSTLAYSEGFYYKPRIDEELLDRYHDGLICLSACVAGALPQLLLNGKDAEAENWVKKYRRRFGEDYFYIELQDHGLPEQRAVAPKLIEIANRQQVPLVVTNDIHYVDASDWEAQEVMMCIGTKKELSDPNRMTFGSREFYLKDGDAMAKLFPDCPQAVANSLKIAEQCAENIIPHYETEQLKECLPIYQIPDGFTDADAYLHNLIVQGIAKLYPDQIEQANKRAEYEFDIIVKMGFTGYFLIVWDFIFWAKQNGIPIGPGRGSGAGSIVAYALGITNIDPLRFNLIFERFLNPERVSMPDFDIDIGDEDRQRVIEYTRQKYGEAQVGHIVTFSTLKAKSVVLDVGRVLSMPLAEVRQLTKLIPNNLKARLRDAFVKNNEIEDSAQLANLRHDPQYEKLFDICEKLEDMNRGTGLHASGIVIGKTALIDWVPMFTQKDTTGKILSATQFVMSEVEHCGLVKMDYLGLKTLSILQHAENLIRQRKGYENFDVGKVPMDDAAVFDLFCAGDTAGVFQFESPGMQRVLQRAKPRCIEELIALNALYRPGPMAYIDDFVNGKFKPETIKYHDPSLQNILQETYGVMVYQEQVMQVAQRIAGYSLGQADILRRAMAKKKTEAMVAEKEKFIAGAVTNGFDANHAGGIFEVILPFCDYGFNKSHAAAYSVVAYHTAYLKVHFSLEYTAASLTNEMHKAGDNQIADYIENAKQYQIEILLPDVNSSGKVFTPHDGKIAFALCALKGVGEAAAAAIVSEREKNGKFQSFYNFCERIDLRVLNKANLEALIKTGAFDSLGGRRSQYMAALENALAFGQAARADRDVGAIALFGGETENAAALTEPQLPDLSEWNVKTKLEFEREYLGFYASGHPLDEYAALLKNFATANTETIKEMSNRATVIIGGIIHKIDIRTNKRNEPYGRVTLEDKYGKVEVMAFAKIYAEAKELLQVNSAVLITCRVENRVDGDREFSSLIADKFAPLANAAMQLAESVQINLSEMKIDADLIAQLKTLLYKNSGNVPVYLKMNAGDNRVAVIRLNSEFSVSPSAQFITAGTQLFGKNKLNFSSRAS